MPFNLRAAVSKRSPADLTYEVPKRSRVAPPSAALLKDLDAPATVAPQTIPGTAPMIVVVLKVSDCAADSMPEYMGVQAGLFEVMMEWRAMFVGHPLQACGEGSATKNTGACGIPFVLVSLEIRVRLISSLCTPHGCGRGALDPRGSGRRRRP